MDQSVIENAMDFQQTAVVETAPLQEELMLFQPQTNKFCILNRTTSFIWSCLASPRTAEQLAEELCRHFEGVTPPEALRDVQSTLQEMLSLELVVAAPSSQP
jgi:hypothetical protein